jgi:hypothetical protein
MTSPKQEDRDVIALGVVGVSIGAGSISGACASSEDDENQKQVLAAEQSTPRNLYFCLSSSCYHCFADSLNSMLLAEAPAM